MKKTITILVLTLVSSVIAFGQDLISTNFKYLPQTAYSNPAKTPECNFFIGFPGLASTSFAFSHSGFAYSDLIRKRADDSLYLDVENMLSKLKASNYLSARLNMDLLTFGFRAGKNYFSANITEKVIFQQTYPKDLLRFLWRGNGDFIGQTADFSSIDVDLTHYREFAFAYSRTFSDKLSVGFRAKYLQGLSNVSTEKSDLSLYTDDKTYDLMARANLKVNSSGFADLMDKGSFDAKNYLVNWDNKGYAFDAGVNYKINDDFSVNASVEDLGKINWKSQLRSYSAENAEFTFSGVDIQEFVSPQDSTDYISELVDSLYNSLNLKEDSTAYSTHLSPKFYIGGTWHFTKSTDLSLTGYGEIFKGKPHPSFSVSLTQQIASSVSLAASYSYINGSMNNIGAGILFNAGPVQLYVMSDNVLGAFLPENTHNLHVRTGMNFVFGYKDKEKRDKPENSINDKDGDGIADSVDKCPESAGLAKFGGCPDSDGDNVPDYEDSCPTVAGDKANQGCPEHEF